MDEFKFESEEPNRREVCEENPTISKNSNINDVTIKSIKQELDHNWDSDDMENFSKENTFAESEEVFEKYIANVDKILKVNLSTDPLILFNDVKQELGYAQQFNKNETKDFDFQKFQDLDKETQSHMVSRNVEVWNRREEKPNCNEEGMSGDKTQLSEESEFIVKDQVDNKLKKCNMCDYRTRYNSALNSHIKSIHLKIRDFKCDLCNFTTTRNVYLRYHIDQVHLKIKNHVCHLCEYRTYQRKHLEGHIKSVHLKQRDYKCEICGYCATQKNHLKQHVDTVHKKLKEQQCHLCNYRTTQKVHLTYHIEAVHLKIKDIKCELCDYSANKRGSVDKHMKNVHLNLKCDLCDYVASRKTFLKYHIESVHQQLRKYKCDECEFSTTLKNTLKHHKNKIHPINCNKLYKCDQCPFTTSKEVDLKGHIDNVHLVLLKQEEL